MHDVQNHAGSLHNPCNTNSRISPLSPWFSCQVGILKKIWVPADLPEAARPPQGGELSGCGRTPDGCHRDACPRGKGRRRQQFILRQFANGAPTPFQSGAGILPSRRHVSDRLHGIQKPVDCACRDPLAMILAWPCVCGHDSFADPLPQQAHAHVEEPRHMGDRPYLSFHGAQLCQNLRPAIANPVQHP